MKNERGVRGGSDPAVAVDHAIPTNGGGLHPFQTRRFPYKFTITLCGEIIEGSWWGGVDATCGGILFYSEAG